jgi:glycosyltransferase involved in cell wall biosynthesis
VESLEAQEPVTKIDVLLDARLTRRMSVGMRAYTTEMAALLPRGAPDLHFGMYTCGENFRWDEQVGLPLHVLRTRARLTHFLSVYAPVFAPQPFVITIHDLIHLWYPQFFKRTVGPYYRTIVRAVCARAARVITDDEATVVDLERFLGVAPAKVRVIALGCDEIYVRDRLPEGVERPFFIYAGNHREHKDLSTLFSAWAALPEHLEADLYLTGEDDLPPAQHVTRKRGAVRFLGEVPIERLAGLYRACVALVHPALREGFGLPMLEAGASGARVIACADAVPLVLRPYVDVFTARDVVGLRALMTRALDGGDEERWRPLRAAARALTWEACARATAEVYREVLEERRSG